MNEETVLLVDDEPEIVKLMGLYLKQERFRLLTAASGGEALDIIRKEKVDLVVLDVMMPGMNGIDTCMAIREIRQMPIIFLSAKSEEIDKIHGLSVGADDYVSKPFSPLELLARIKSQLRRYGIYGAASGDAASPDAVTIDGVTFNSATREVTVEGQEVRLTPREFSILELLGRNPGRVYSIEQLYEMIWQETFFEAGNTVMVHIRKLREKIEADPRHPRYIKTVWGVGYKMEKL
ncbi:MULTISPECIES: response regulator transcription factor [unclassified Paenibacillus]|uniref:response regulator transcription factor n=1 Tax=unclassified Paenibacillus TaxID=185978 RepID=UPI000956FB1B|nr:MULTISPECIES: response regulator transcription factor [unclassified Paenibacillus]ASS68175.1 response regulator transcription factor [Paenibacillus sp. RUD330]SIR70127.1 DNA-binding response regulator, OmpR family, contains REC and winged-helix (wHTH) domain [Paenibacillus sp. RU4X]SIR77345.1 DNA-binding response regulator, OmpR family, contains REC and winged-helix (wHTH) domain [Paenibacillus sp. RU4T]